MDLSSISEVITLPPAIYRRAKSPGYNPLIEVRNVTYYHHVITTGKPDNAEPLIGYDCAEQNDKTKRSDQIKTTFCNIFIYYHVIFFCSSDGFLIEH